MLRLCLIAFMLTSILLVGCGPKPEAQDVVVVGSGPAHWQSFPVEIYADPKFENKPNAESDLLAALNYWEQKTSRQLFIYKGIWRGADPQSNGHVDPINAPVNEAVHENPWPFQPQILAVTYRVEQASQIRRAVITLNEGLFVCYGECTHGELGVSFRKLLSHEVGHFLGLDHNQNIKNVMYPIYQENIPLSQMDVDWEALTKLLP